MFDVKIVSVGKMKEHYFADACGEYQKRLSKFCSFSVSEIDEAKLFSETEGEIRGALQKEGESICKKIEGFVVALCVEGKSLSSEALSELIKTIPEKTGRNKISFVIGSSHGLCDEVKKRADFQLSLSALTLPHQLARVVLTEQIYRAFCIMEGTKYHK